MPETEVSSAPAAAADVAAFWREAGSRKWFKKDPRFDDNIRARFEPLHLAASRGEITDWAQSPEGALALVILLDQFPRNLYRDSGHAFATDPLALSIARRAVDTGQDQRIPADLRFFLYMPFEHSERMEDQDQSLALFTAMSAAANDPRILASAVQHRDIIARFGRFPHRNACLGRVTTAEEQAFLDAGGFHG